MNYKKACIIVLYNPNLNNIIDNIKNLSQQCDKIYIIDNTPDQNLTSFFKAFHNIQYIPLKKNVGIAEAQNITLREIIKQNYDFIFFSDQDSLITKNMIEDLLTKYQFLRTKKIKIGGIGPRPFDKDLNRNYKGSIKKGINIGNNLTEVTEIISSASLIPIQNFKEVGLMDAKLFIDGVDHEWCWRAKKIGNYRFFIDEDSLLSHKLGEGDRKIFGINVHIPTPFRTYYQFRNYFLLSRRNYVPLYWKVSNGIKYFFKFFYYPLFLPQKKLYLKNMLNGIRDGIFRIIQ